MAVDVVRTGRGELTAEQHARIRWQLLLMPAYIWLVYGWAYLLVRLPRLEPVKDFAHFYVLGVIARERNASALYDADAMAAIVARVIPGAAAALFPPAYGPQMALFFIPFAWLPYFTALYLWVALSLLAYAACAYAFWRICPRLHDRPWTTTVLLVASISVTRFCDESSTSTRFATSLSASAVGSPPT